MLPVNLRRPQEVTGTQITKIITYTDTTILTNPPKSGQIYRLNALTATALTGEVTQILLPWIGPETKGYGGAGVILNLVRNGSVLGNIAVVLIYTHYNDVLNYTPQYFGTYYNGFVYIEEGVSLEVEWGPDDLDNPSFQVVVNYEIIGAPSPWSPTPPPLA
jgi:hypothetical protein